MKLFREEAIDNQKDSNYGEIIIPTSIGMWISVLTTIGIITVFCLFICFGKYTRKAHLSGIVMPSTGLIKVYSHYSGYVTALTVSEGQHVSAGTALYYISGEHFDEQGKGTLDKIKLSLKLQYQMLVSQQIMEHNDNKQQQQSVHQKISSLQFQIKSAEQRLLLAKDQVQLSASLMKRYMKLLAKNYASDLEIQQKKMELAALKENVEEQRQVLLQLQKELSAVTDELKHLIAQGESQKIEFDKQLEGINQELVELTGKEKFTLNSPVSGTIAAVLVKQGQTVKVSEPLLTLISDNAHLQIELYATSKNAGFIELGQKVALRFTAFPYQKFGVQYGIVKEISSATLMSSDLISLSPFVLKESEGYYRIIVIPEQNYIIAYGKKQLLRPGMTLEADINLDTRHLWEWLTEPIWSIKGKI